MEKWNKLLIGTVPYVIKFQKNATPDSDPIVTCWLSNFKSIWTESIASISILQKRFSELNRRLDIDDDQLLDIVSRLPESIQHTKFEPDDNEKHKLCFEYDLSKEVKVRHFWLLQKSNEQSFYEHITKPMMAQMLELHANHTKLIDLVKRKDQEIEQYKLDGATLTRKQLATKPFHSDDVALEADMFECSATELASEFGVFAAVQSTETKDDTAGGGTPGSAGSKAKAIKGPVPLKRIQPIQYYENSDDESQADEETSSFQNISVNKQTRYANHTKRNRKTPNL